MTRPFPWGYLDHHFVAVMDAYSDGRVKVMQVEDLRFSPNDEGEAARVWAVANDLEPERGDELLKKWRTYRTTTPPSVPDNIVLGDS